MAKRKKGIEEPAPEPQTEDEPESKRTQMNLHGEPVKEAEVSIQWKGLITWKGDKYFVRTTVDNAESWRTMDSDALLQKVRRKMRELPEVEIYRGDFDREADQLVEIVKHQALPEEARLGRPLA